jgi:iduronate 2-sulfatase
MRLRITKASLCATINGFSGARRRPAAACAIAAMLLSAGCTAARDISPRAGPAVAPATVERPNILLILVDDLKPAIHAFGDPVAITPNIDRLAARGTRFELAYANQAVCAPSRLNLMTGARSTSSGIYDFGQNLRDYMPDAVTMPQYFMAAGYRAESIGKTFHIGHNTVGDPQSWSANPYKDHVIEYVSPRGQGAGQDARGGLVQRVRDPEAAMSGTYAKHARPRDRVGSARRARRGLWRRPRRRQSRHPPRRTAARRASPSSSRSASPARICPSRSPGATGTNMTAPSCRCPAFERMPEGAPAYAGKVGGEINAYAPIDRRILREAHYPEELKRTLIHGYYAGRQLSSMRRSAS